ncbi:hypothetical protein D9M68_975620 [compost metagenome]
MSDGSLPVKVGLVSSVTPPLAMLPVMAPTSSIRSSHSGSTGGTGGALKSTVKFQPLVLALSLPAASTAAARKLCTPSPRSVSGSKLQVPLAASTAAEPSSVSPS